MYNLFLDDFRMPKDCCWVDLPLVDWAIVRNYNEFCTMIENQGIPSIVSFDHDLGDEAMREAVSKNFKDFDYSKVKEKTGLDCAKFLIEKCIKNGVRFPQYTVHSINPIGRQNIVELIEIHNALFDLNNE